MKSPKFDCQAVALLSGKGGSGKTVISLSLCRVLAEAGVKTLLVDLDVATHGATYFFENALSQNKKTLSIADLTSRRSPKGEPLSTSAGFDFIPSTTRPQDLQSTLSEVLSANSFGQLNSAFTEYFKNYSAIVLDCQAGYSPLTKWAVSQSHRNLLVLEADAVSSAAIRVLYLQIGEALKPTTSWQIFNKLTEEERPVYEKISGGTFFPNLPPIPFDWEVRAAFAIGEIPSVTSKGSAFGLGVLRLMKTLLPKSSKLLDELENRTVGNWYRDIETNLKKLEDRKREIMYQSVELVRRRKLSRARTATTFLAGIAIVATIVDYALPVVYTGALIGGMVTVGALFWQWLVAKDIRSERQQDSAQESIVTMEKEIEKYRTLFVTDPRLREYSRRASEGMLKRAGV